MTTTRENWATDTRIPPKSNEAVAQIMAEKGVNRRRAYAMLRAEKAAEVDTSNVGQGQRIAVLTCLVAHPEAGRDAPILLAALHDAGIKIDMHDTVKTLWALQKTQYIQFRERGGRSLYAIKITDAGLAWVAGLKPKGDDNELLPGPVAATVEEAPEEAKRVFRNAQKLQQEIDALTDLAEAPPLKLPSLPSGYSGPDWPQLTALRQRAAKAEKINQAAKLLEEAGIEDVAIDLMDRTKFNSLEEEVIRLLRTLGEIE